MTTKFVLLNEAAKILGLTPERVAEMRSNGAIHGYRDGTSWKFKPEEIARVAAELKSRGTSSAETHPHDEPAGGQDDVGRVGKDSGDEEVSILVSEEELGQSGETSSSTIIGDAEAESDLRLQTGSRSESDVSLVPGAGVGSDVSLVPDPGSDREVAALRDSEMEIQSASTGGTGRLDSLGSDMTIGSSDLDVSIDSELALSDDDEVVLSGSEAGGDLTLGTADSGINLASPSDSGLSLEADSGIHLQSPTDSGLSLEEESLEMGGSSISSLELGEDEQAVGLEEGSGVKKEEEFALAPSDDMFADESDSGSQVIALEESGAFDQDAMLQAGGAGLLEETTGLEQKLETLGAAAALGPARMMGPAYAGIEFPEASYSVWNVMGLLTILLFLSISGILLTDIVQNMWAWEEARDVSTSISEGLTGMIFRR